MKVYSILINRISPLCKADMVSFFQLPSNGGEPVALDRRESEALVSELGLTSNSWLVSDTIFASGFYCLHNDIYEVLDYLRDKVFVSSFDFFGDKLVIEFGLPKDIDCVD